MTTVNYDVIVQELERSICNAETLRHCFPQDKPMLLKELYTLGFAVSRQNGKTRWLIENLMRKPDAYLIVINDTMREEIANRLTHYLAVDNDNKAPLVPGERIPIDADLGEAIRAGGPEFIDGVLARVQTSFQLKRAIDYDLRLIHDVERIYFDGRVQIFDRIRIAKYYTWLAKISNKHITTWLID